VGIIKEIYIKAWHVVIWLRKENLEDQVAFSLLDLLEHTFTKNGLVEIGPEYYHYLRLSKFENPE
jgi:hypothetical protein